MQKITLQITFKFKNYNLIVETMNRHPSSMKNESQVVNYILDNYDELHKNLKRVCGEKQKLEKELKKLKDNKR